jgi:predicted anti-sigma-YlaC factor YlaD
MSEYGAFTGLPLEVNDGQTHRWAAILVKAVFAILVVGVVLSAILWPSVSADVGALVLCVAFAACTGLMVIRQALLAEQT